MEFSKNRHADQETFTPRGSTTIIIIAHFVQQNTSEGPGAANRGWMFLLDVSPAEGQGRTLESCSYQKCVILSIHINVITLNINNKVLQNQAQQIRGQALKPDFKKHLKHFEVFNLRSNCALKWDFPEGLTILSDSIHQGGLVPAGERDCRQFVVCRGPPTERSSSPALNSAAFWNVFDLWGAVTMIRFCKLTARRLKVMLRWERPSAFIPFHLSLSRQTLTLRLWRLSSIHT